MCSLDDATAPPRRTTASTTRPRDGSLFLDDPDGNGIQLMPYRDDDDRRPDIARTDARRCPASGPRKLGHVNLLTGRIAEQADLLHRRAGHARDRLAGRRRHLVPRQRRPPRDGARRTRATPHFHHLAFDMVDWGKLRVAFDHLAQHGRWLGWGPVRHGLGQNLCGYVRIPEEELLRRALLRHGAARARPRAARVAGRPPLVQHLGAAAAPLVLPLRRGGRRATSARASRCSARSSHRSRRSRSDGHGDHRATASPPAPASSSWTACAATRARSG